jgi:uncharacterized cupin superfamily protein
MYVGDHATAELQELGPKANATAGTPVESILTLHDYGPLHAGIWECTPGVFPSARDGISEVMTFLSGDGTIYDADGTAHPIGPGVTMVLTDGWNGRWEIRQTVRKSFTIVRTA